MNLDLIKIHPSCRNLTENKEEGRLDFTLEYQREGSQPFEVIARSSEGVKMYVPNLASNQMLRCGWQL
nr:hypothetical transcript [Hymenolepis microstoma]